MLMLFIGQCDTEHVIHYVETPQFGSKVLDLNRCFCHNICILNALLVVLFIINLLECCELKGTNIEKVVHHFGNKDTMASPSWPGCQDCC